MSDAAAAAPALARRGLIGAILRLIARAPSLSKPDAELLARIKFPCC